MQEIPDTSLPPSHSSYEKGLYEVPWCIQTHAHTTYAKGVVRRETDTAATISQISFMVNKVKWSANFNWLKEIKPIFFPHTGGHSVKKRTSKVKLTQLKVYFLTLTQNYILHSFTFCTDFRTQSPWAELPFSLLILITKEKKCFLGVEKPPIKTKWSQPCQKAEIP